jgi:hypothetical protein
VVGTAAAATAGLRLLGLLRVQSVALPGLVSFRVNTEKGHPAMAAFAVLHVDSRTRDMGADVDAAGPGC